MGIHAEQITQQEISSLAQLREKGSSRMLEFLDSEIDGLDVLECVAYLADTPYRDHYYRAIQEARASGISWRKITVASNSKTTTTASQSLHNTYKSYADNNF